MHSRRIFLAILITAVMTTVTSAPSQEKHAGWAVALERQNSANGAQLQAEPNRSDEQPSAADQSSAKDRDDDRDDSKSSERLKPNDVDDTVQLQAALDSCSGATPPCQIVLSKGVFHTDVLLVRNFRGRIRGQGAGHTIVRPVAGIALRSTAVPFLADPTLAEPYPVLLHFADGGDIHLTDFTLEFPEDMQVEPYDAAGPIKDALLSAIMVDGTETARLVVSRLEIIATERPPETSRFGSALLNAIRFEGQIRLVNGIEIVTPLAGGEFVAHDTSIRGVGLGFALRDLRNVNAEIVDNAVQNARLLGVFLTDMGNSDALVADNRISSELTGVQILRGVRPPEDPSTFRVARNAFKINELGTSLFGPGDGLVFVDITPDGGIDRAFVRNNDITLGVEAFEGIFVLGDRGGVHITGNQISGPALDAGITIVDSRGTHTRQNDFSDLEPGKADVWLQSTTSDCRVVEPDGTVLDEGSNNEVKAQTVITTP
jgi:hypothetical protein